ncbi:MULTISPECIES: FxSxx-COOH system tetratricopeptide repeat protein [Streptomycetaceae]|uniref:ATP/GTP binding protein n=1 Tax=Streptantibioticus cattleyicolor (strain ATCC 35852 / DSM 46488 / JCM 4925 / NBRC 14057 / NRRL 8057) TaxID=1003195 RepID=F8JPD2_STREN|nr:MULTISPECIES: FxSxx-COOH system tetratricopeptide repeat protein [Streptomycetaceae]AEW96485.1 ATP/GTP binding protein [Streptantibioticus cattleyicolor NRRL 8057 = DSM 46488]MYS60988.1 tetratricopeptide repeat protein [Streptomyces sp. SID5468]CCB76819.1 ATP/GTP binding protein [Streptantibioticus cattleyicolor NRRL 8057 = DSM 46488]
MTPQAQAPGTREHFTISYAGYNRPWAAWIAHQLEQQGHGTALLRWDPPLGMALTEALANLLTAPGRVLLVLDDWYFQLGPRTDTEWTQALADVVPANLDRFAAVSVATRALPPTAAPLGPVDLRDLDAREARRRILRRLGLDPAAGEAGPDGFSPRFPNDPPAVWNLPRRNVRFTGRDSALEALHERFAAGGRGGARVALRGISGVGKSQIAAEYAHRFGNDYDIVWWVNAGYRATAREQFAALAPRLGLETGQELGDRIRAVHEALRTGHPYRRWLVVFDSADDTEQIEDLLPEGNGHVLLTTLTQDWAATGAVGEIEVRPFLREESVAYARRRAERLTAEEADDLADAVEDLPLLLAQTAAWLAGNPMPAKDYIELIRRGNPAQIAIRMSQDYSMGFQTSWSITLNTLSERSPEATELLHLFAFFSPEAIPVRMIQNARPADLPDHLAALAADPIRWHTALRRLSESTAVRMDYVTEADREPMVDTVQMHRLYHGFLLGNLSEDRRDRLSAAACRVLVSADPRAPGDTREWSRYAAIIPHLEPADALSSGDPDVQRLLINCIEYLKTRGEYSSALRLCELTVDRWQDRLPPDDSTMLLMRVMHANMLRRSGRYRESEAVSRAVVDELTETRPADDPDLLWARNSLGGSMLALGAYEEARALFTESVATYTRVLGEEAPLTVQDRNNLAVALHLLGRYEEALQQHQVNLRIAERQTHPGHYRTLYAGTQCAWLLRLLGRYREATSKQEQIVGAYRRAVDRYSPGMLRAEHNLALCLRRSGDSTAGEALMRSVVERFVQAQGPSHPETLLVQADHANFVRKHGDLDHAHRLSRTVADRYRNLVGADHPYAIGTEGNVSLVLRSLGDREASLAVAERACHAMSRAVGPDHPWTLGCALNTAGARNLVGDEEHAAELSRDTLGRAKATLGDTHPLTLSCKAGLAADLRALRRSEEAAKLEQEVLQQLTDTLGAQHSHTVSVRRRERPYWDFEPQPS